MSLIERKYIVIVLELSVCVKEFSLPEKLYLMNIRYKMKIYSCIKYNRSKICGFS